MSFDLKDAVAFACELTQEDAGRFYGPPDDVAIGIGVMFGGIAFPLFDPAKTQFQIREGVVLILTHECDVDQDNSKPFNSDVIFAPLASFDAVFGALSKKLDPPTVKGYIGDLAKGRISQLFYLPPWDKYPNGAVIYFNRITNSHISQFQKDGAQKLVALSGYGYRRLCERVSHHLLRPKADRLPMTA